MSRSGRGSNGFPRYAARSFPAYRYVPGHAHHPRRHVSGHSHGLPEPSPAEFRADSWDESEDYAAAFDLYNFGYWWESHEVFEALWNALGRDATVEGRLLRGMVWLAAAQLKAQVGSEKVALRFLRRARLALEPAIGERLGVDVAELAGRLDACLAAGVVGALRVRLGKREAGRYGPAL